MKTIATAALAAALVGGAVAAFQLHFGGSGVAEAAAAPPAAAATAPPPAEPTPAPEPVTGEQAFNTECSACHMAYPPVLLPARSWQALTADLTNHFGEDASLDAATTQKITEYLEANAAETSSQRGWILSGVASGQVPLRITNMPWWRRAHNEVPDSVFARAEIVSKSNCLACHRSGGGEGAEDD